jgi:DNA-binding transcriptional LysR family regulator
MQLRALAAFLTVAECMSVTAAAEGLGLTQPGLSRQIQKLEHEVGMLLFTRSRDGLQLTPAGERFRDFAEDVTARYRILMEDLGRDVEPLTGRLHVFASTVPGEFVLPPLIAQFTSLHPGVQAVVSIADSSQAIEALRDRQCDLAFVGAHINHASLRFDPVAEDEVVLAVPTSHPLAHGTPISVSALEQQRFIGREDGSGTIMSVRRVLAAHGAELPPHRVVMTLSTTRAIISAVRAGYGIGFVSTLALREPEADGVVAVRFANMEIRRALFMVRNERRVSSRIARQFAAMVLEQSTETQAAPAQS